MATAPQDDTQRSLEQRALRNVRGLVDKMEDLEAHDTRKQRRYLAAIVGGTLAAFIALAVGLWFIGHRGENAGRLVTSPKPPAAAPSKNP